MKFTFVNGFNYRLYYPTSY